MKKALLLLCLAGVLFIALAAQNNAPGATSARSSSQPQQGVASSFSMALHSSDGHTVLGKPTISATYINRVLAAHGSPAAGTGQALYDLGVQYGIDPAWPLAVFWQESHYGTTGEATVTHSLGNERCIPDRPCTSNHFAVFTSWVDSYQHWYRLILVGYVRGDINRSIGQQACPCTTIEQIIPIYVGDGSEQQYIADVLASVAQFHAGRI